MTIYFSADFHYGHKNMTGPKVSDWKSGYRNFDTTEEMNDAIVKSINDTVGVYDDLIFLGDWSFGGKANIKIFRDRVQCRQIQFLRGNHDVHLWKDEYMDLFSDVKDYLEFRYRKILFCCSHYAFRVWNESHRGSFQLFGHSHNSLPPIGRQMDVGWCYHRRPLSIDEVYDRLIQIPINVVDHHTERTT